MLCLSAVDAESGEEAWQSSPARILMTSEQRVPDLESLATLIKVRTFVHATTAFHRLCSLLALRQMHDERHSLFVVMIRFILGQQCGLGNL